MEESDDECSMSQDSDDYVYEYSSCEEGDGGGTGEPPLSGYQPERVS